MARPAEPPPQHQIQRRTRRQYATQDAPNRRCSTAFAGRICNGVINATQTAVSNALSDFASQTVHAVTSNSKPRYMGFRVRG